MNRKNIIAGFMIVFSVMLSSFAFYFWQMLYTPNVLVDKPEQYFAIPEGTSFKDIQNQLHDQGIVNDLVTFSFLARLKSYDQLVKPGMYLLKGDMTNNEAINLLRSGAQTPIKMTFNFARKIEEVPGVISRFMAFDSLDMAKVMLHDTIPAHYGFDSLTFISMFIPNTYEVYWTDSPQKILDRMKTEYDRYWNETRLAKAQEIGMSPKEVSILASIVEAEISKNEEASRVAGLYINRLNRNIPLQADPTLVFAANDFSIRRVLTVHTKINSPYNTYLNEGLPPGPINMPSIISLEGVLNYEKHNYLYMCAKEDFSGYHAFATNLREHNINAARFQAALNKERIYR